MGAPTADIENHQDVKDVSLHEHLQQPPQHHVEESTRNKFLTIVANNMHFTTFAPLIIIQVLQDIDLALGAILCVVWVLLTLAVSWLLKRHQYLKVFPKKYDLFNLQLYCTVIVLAYTVQHWIHNWISVYINGSNAWFMWATILLPCYNNFVMDSIRDRLPDPVAAHPITQRMALLISGTWATALTIMAAAAIVPAAANVPPRRVPIMIIICSYVLGLGPMVVAMILQHVIKARYTRKLKAALAAEQPAQEVV